MQVYIEFVRHRYSKFSNLYALSLTEKIISAKICKNYVSTLCCFVVFLKPLIFESMQGRINLKKYQI